MVDELEGAIAEDAGGRVIDAPWGKSYEVADKVAAMPLLRFAHLSRKGVDSTDMEGLAAIYDMLRAVFTPEAWARFEEESTEARANDEDLLSMIPKAIEVISARPIRSPSGSPPSSQTTTEKSTDYTDMKRRLGLVPVSPEALVG